jgi:hypothetical protein
MQTVVHSAPPIGSPGDLADQFTAAESDIRSAVNEETTASILPGTMVKRGTAARTAKNLTDSHETPFGVVTRGHAFSVPTQLDGVEVSAGVFFDGLKPGVPFGVGRDGRYVVIIEENVSITDEVHVRAVATTGEIAGAFAASDLGADGINCSAFAEWVEGGTVDPDTGFGVAVVELHMGLASLSVTDS